jgi:hypothetical protein
MKESITKARHSLDFAIGELNQAHAAADPVSAILLYAMIRDCAALANRVTALMAALEAKETE